MKIILVLVMWLHVNNPGPVQSFTIDSIDFGGIAKNPDACASLPMAEVLKEIPGSADKIAAGLVPKAICGMAAPDGDTIATEPPAKREVPSTPGHGDWDHGSSAPL